MTDLTPTNFDVIGYYKEYGVDKTVEWLLTFSQSLNSNNFSIKASTIRLFKTYQDKNKSRIKEENNGTAGSIGTFNHWIQCFYIFPESRKVTPTLHTSENHTELDHPTTLTPVITRQGCLNAQSKLIDITNTLEETQNDLDTSEEKNYILREYLSDMKANLKRTLTRETYHRRKSSKLEDFFSDSKLHNMEDLNKSLDSATMNMKCMKEEGLEMSEKIKTLTEKVEDLENPNVETFDKDHNVYSSSFRQMVYTLLQHHVGIEHIGPVIDAVLGFVGKSATRLPSEKTVRNMNIERLGLSQMQLAEQITSKPNTTLYSDETSKFSEKYIGFHTTDNENNHWVLGIRDLATKSADDTFQTFKEVLQDIEDRKNCSTSKIGHRILANIQNTMSDRAATEMKWHHLLENYRKNILPEVVDGWNQLSDSDRQPLERLSNFYCGLHSFVQIALVSSAALNEIEKNSSVLVSGPQFIRSNEAGTVRLIRTAAKTFARGGDDQSGCYGDFRLYIKQTLDEFKMTSIPFVPFRGNRFNIIFFNGGFIYFLHKHMIEYLKGKKQLNQLQKGVFEDLKQPFYIAGCKALGLLSKLVTAPLWRIIENRDIHIMDFASFIQDIVSFLQQACTNLNEFMMGKMVPTEKSEWKVKKDHVYHYLITPSTFDNDVETILGVVIPAIAKLLQNHYSDFLEGGQFHQASSEVRDLSKSVEKHNKFAERVFAYTDQLLRFKPNISHLSQESYIMFCLNGTAEWLAKKSEKEQEQLVTKSRKAAREIHKEYIARRALIQQQRSKNQELKRQEEEQRKLKKIKERETIFKDILYYGLYQRTEEVTERITSIKGKLEKEDALKAQIRFRQIILEQEADPNLFRFSEKLEDGTGKRRFLSAEELMANVRELILSSHNIPMSQEDCSRSSYLIGRKIQHSLLSDGELTDYNAVVISCVPGYPSWFNIKYDGYNDIYVEKLQAEMEEGNIRLIDL